eukprot:CAMPEP_0206545916 /NCGR_PEP_ID=MMETSP0325_2-20121206/12407_1 /ASSEMBLY_ACC=CAM_ASM_000347 /TAXON_ID=2866 /ORGANISM="Crypthecodinium cohnii, Strain Seligo" /LENGTH=452 /DNA_ID=CAMNT_0054044965 /DNA_START=97 /DNA_END=1455 /DNA_ORIENTATION=+
MAHRRTAAWKKFVNTETFKQALPYIIKATGGTVAAGCGLALGLKQLKTGLNYQEPKDIWPEVSFDLRKKFAKPQGGPSKALCDLGGFSLDEFWEAASRLRPVELELEEAREGPEPSKATSELMARWKESGIITKTAQEPPRADLFGRRLTSDAQGVDIGVLVPPYLAPLEGVPTVKVPTWEPRPTLRKKVVDALDTYGVALLQGAIESEDIKKLRDELGFLNGKLTRRATELGQWLQQMDPNVGMGRYTFGRLHCLLRGSPEFEPTAVAAHAAVAPLVYSYFKTATKGNMENEKIFLSEAQIIINDPLAETQGWHLDNASGRPAITFLVPLTDIHHDRGSQAILPGSHRFCEGDLSLSQRLGSCFRALCESHGAIFVATPERKWAAGDVLVLDGRVMHKGLANEGLGAPTAMLVLRYDLTDSPPPGSGRGFLRFMSRLARTTDHLFRLYAAV